MADLQVGQRIKDNDPRMAPRVLTIIEVRSNCVLAENVSRRVFSIMRKRIHTDGKPRRTGFTALQFSANPQAKEQK